MPRFIHFSVILLKSDSWTELKVFLRILFLILLALGVVLPNVEALSVTEFAVYIKEEAVNIPIIVIAGISVIVLIIIGIIIFKKLAHK